MRVNLTPKSLVSWTTDAVNPFKAAGIAMAYKLIDAAQARWPPPAAMLRNYSGASG
jgi:hypothetical protein